MNPEKLNFENIENNEQNNSEEAEVPEGSTVLTPEQSRNLEDLFELKETDVAQENSIEKLSEEDKIKAKKEISQCMMDQVTARYEGRKEEAESYDEKIHELFQKIHPGQQLSEENISEFKKEILNESNIAYAPDLRALYNTIADNRVEITGSDGSIYDARNLLHLIDEVVAGRLDIKVLPRGLGLRDKVSKLLDPYGHLRKK